MVEKSKTAIAGVLTLFILAILILSGPAQAFLSSISLSDSAPVKGDQIILDVKATVEADEILDIQNFSLVFVGVQNFSCMFDVDGVLLSSCPIIVEKISSPTSQYGYGYLPGDFKFKIKLNTTTLNAGNYKVHLVTSLTDEDKLSDNEDLLILSLDLLDTCSIRAKSGTVFYNNTNVGSKNSLSLYKSKNAAVKGDGILTALPGKNRVKYDFKITRAYHLDANTIVFETTGNLQQDRLPSSVETAKIFYNSSTSKVTVVGQKLNAQSMDVNFARC